MSLSSDWSRRPVCVCVCVCLNLCVCVCVCELLASGRGIKLASRGPFSFFSPQTHTLICREHTHTYTHTYILSLSLSHTHTLTAVDTSLSDERRGSRGAEPAGICENLLSAGGGHLYGKSGRTSEPTGFVIAAWLSLSAARISRSFSRLLLLWDSVLEFRRRRRAAGKNRDMCFASAAYYYCRFSPIH